MFGRKKKSPQEIQHDLDCTLFRASGSCGSGGDWRTVKEVLAAGADVHAQDDRALREAVYSRHTTVVETLIEAGANVLVCKDGLLWLAERYDDRELRRTVLAAIQTQEAQREKERLELERQRNPLRAGAGLTFVESRPEDMEVLLRDAMAEQAQMRYPARAGAPGRECVPLPQP